MIDTVAPGASATVAETPLPKKSRPVRWIPIAPGSSATPCDILRGIEGAGPHTCTAMIYFSPVSRKTGKRQPVSMNHPAALHPTGTTWGQGVTHYADCPDAIAFRKPR